MPPGCLWKAGRALQGRDHAKKLRPGRSSVAEEVDSAPGSPGLLLSLPRCPTRSRLELHSSCQTGCATRRILAGAGVSKRVRLSQRRQYKAEVPGGAVVGESR